MKAPNDRPVRVRMAPSPTGPIHVGNIRAGIYNWLFARQNDGVFVLRIEDTDTERSRKEFDTQILEAFTWLGIDWDEGPTLDGGHKGDHGPYRQSERKDIYKKHLEQLLHEGKAYYCYCTPEELEAQKQSLSSQGLAVKYSGRCHTAPPAGREPQVIRLATPNVNIEVKDIIRGTLTFDAGLLGDMIIAKDLNRALYHFAVVVDDELMQISHVIRGEDHLSNTPKHILIQRALGFETPIYAHLPLMLNETRQKLSKRSAETSLMELQQEGFLPEAIINFLALMGWHPSGDESEVMTTNELIEKFELKRVQKGGAVYNTDKLHWLNREHIKSRNNKNLVKLLIPFLHSAGIEAGVDQVIKALALVKDRMTTLADFLTLSGFLFKLPEYPEKLLVWKDSNMADTKNVLEKVKHIFVGIIDNKWVKDELQSSLTPMMEEKGRGSVLWPLRVAVSGMQSSPDPLDIAITLGKEETLRRIEVAIKKLG